MNERIGAACDVMSDWTCDRLYPTLLKQRDSRAGIVHGSGTSKHMPILLGSAQSMLETTEASSCPTSRAGCNFAVDLSGVLTKSTQKGEVHDG